jgi:hypothetical protein
VSISFVASALNYLLEIVCPLFYLGNWLVLREGSIPMWLGMMVDESILPSQADKLYRIQNLCTFINTAMQVMIEDEKKDGELNVETSRS